MSYINIIGGGVTGLCIARQLLDQGANIRLFERGEGVGPHACSWWAGGMLAPFCEGENAEDTVVNLGQEAASWWSKNTDEVTRNGTLVVSLARDHSDLNRFSRCTRNYTELQNKDISKLEPDLGERFQKGLFFKDEAHLAPRNALAALYDGLIKDGLKIINEEVDPVKIAKEGITIDCRGYSAQDNLPELRGVKGEMIILHSNDIEFSRPIRLLHPRIPLYVVPHGDGVFMLGATMIESTGSKKASVRSILELLSAAYVLNPAFGEAEILEIGVDVRPAFPDNLPRVQRDGNLISVNGLYRHGFLLAPALARMVANLIYEHSMPEVMYEHHA